MSLEVQVDFFENVQTLVVNRPSIEELIEEVKDIRAMAHNVRKGIFKRHDEVVKEMSSYYVELHNKIAVLEEEVRLLRGKYG